MSNNLLLFIISIIFVVVIVIITQILLLNWGSIKKFRKLSTIIHADLAVIQKEYNVMLWTCHQ
jgi:hypothetical protein